MDSIYRHIAALSDPGLDWEQAFMRMTACMREICGNCGVGMLSSVGLNTGGYRMTALCHEHDGDGEDRCLFNEEGQHPVFQGGLVELLRDSREPVLLHDVDSGIDEGFADLLTGYHDLIAVPLLLDGVIQRWLLVLGRQGGQLKDIDTERLVLVANLAATYVARVADIRRLEEASRWIRQELDDIARLQRILLPQEDMKIRGLHVAARFEACEQAGGDYYDLVSLSNVLGHESDAWGVMVADAAGHGAAAAVEIAMLDAILRTYSGSQDTTPADVLNYVNPYLFTRMTRGTFITAFVAGYVPAHESLLYAIAGHPPAMLRRQDGCIEALHENAGIPLGVDRDHRWQCAQVSMHSGDMLMLYTDGVTEAKSMAGEAFGEQRLGEIMSGIDNPDDLLAAIEQALEEHGRGIRQQDDQTIIILQLTGQAPV